MTVVRMAPRPAEKPWGRRDLPPPFADWRGSSEPVGEIIFDSTSGTDPELVVKFLFTEEKLSIQVHPHDVAARAAGGSRGKDEAWIVLAAEPGSTIGIGLNHEVSRKDILSALIDGTIEQMINWRPAATGDCFYSPAGTIHAIGAGLSLIEIQQNCDLTYRLFDYGRPRDLHIGQATAVAIRRPAGPAQRPVKIGRGRTWLAGGPAFQVERLSGPASGRLSADDRGVWLLLLRGRGDLQSRTLFPGEVWQLDEACDLRLDADSELIVAYPGASIKPVWHVSL